ncbi:MAG: glycine--tRNA ligase subunit beta [Deltaproteobacteria bacterium]|nr:glycine--tRNA ligase subunit beta [Deltaproteobacteria bacterium]
MKLLLEVGCEELPASHLDAAIQFLPKQLQAELKDFRLSAENIKSLGTPRRIILLAEDLPQKQPDLDSEVLGPKAQIAFNEDGSLSKAGQGFLKSRNINPKDAYAKETPKGKVLAAQLHQAGKPTHEILENLLPKLIKEIPFPKSMRWDTSKTRFSRPIRWILCLLDNKAVHFEIAGIQSGHNSCGHRFMAPQFEKVSDRNYFKFLQKHYVMPDLSERQQIILEQTQALAQSVGGQWRQDPKLLAEVANLVEYPWPILGHFDAKYLDIPQEILISVMREHQRYFAILDANSNLMPYFVCVAGSKPKDPEALAAGNARVLKARFEDGAFYYQEDLKKPLADYVTEAPEMLLSWAHKLSACHPGLRAGVQDDLERAVYLAKADLNTGVISEFPELQGVIGAHYAEKSGEKPEVCEAIKEQYWPRLSGDQTPKSQLGAILSMADKLTTLHRRKLPKGSSDPYGLRRAAIGLTHIVLDHQLDLNWAELIENQDILDFVMTRTRGVFLEKHPVLVVDATQKAANYDLCQWKARIQALEQFDYSAVSAVFKRVHNIVSKADGFTQGDFAFLKEPSEQALLKAVQAVPASENYTKMLDQLGNLKPLLDSFFDDVMVMADDPNLRNARLSLLAEVQQKAAWVADFSKLTI